jgi:hypothetical protein
MAHDRRVHARLPLGVTVRLKRVAGRPEAQIREFEALDISCSGVRFGSDRKLAPGTHLDLEIILLEKSGERTGMKMFTSATVVRLEPPMQGRHGVAVIFDDIAFSRDAAN